MLQDNNFSSPFQIEMKSGEGTTCFLAFEAGVQLHDDYRADKKLASPGGSVEQVTVRTMVRRGDEDRGIDEEVH